MEISAFRKPSDRNSLVIALYMKVMATDPDQYDDYITSSGRNW